MMPGEQEFQLPASRLFVGLSLFAALLLDWLPLSGAGLILRPDFVALVLLYWCVHRPLSVGIGTAWAMGVLTDVADASLFGQHALEYSVLAFGGILLHRRIQLLDLKQQTLQVFPVMLAAYTAYALVHWQSQGYIAWAYFLGIFTSALMWIPLTLLLQRLRRPSTNPDDL
jgi:rod shape-determining protein MreD